MGYVLFNLPIYLAGRTPYGGFSSFAHIVFLM